MKSNKIVIETHISSHLEKVWELWTHPQHIMNWNFATDTWCCPKAENDLRVGGSFKSRMEARDGSFGFDFEGVYDEVVEHSKISYTMGDGRKVTTRFESIQQTTKITTDFDPETTNSIEMQKSGWQSILNNFKKYCEKT